MNKFLSLVLAASICAPVFAQKMGMSNNDAPMVKQTIEAGGAKMSLNYTSITWASGKTMEAAMDKDKGAAARKRINATAKDEPLATFSTSVDVQIGTLKLAAGDYKVGFTINDNLEWEINFTGKDTQTLKLPLMANKEMTHKRLLCSLFAGDDHGAGVYVAFGDKNCVLNITPAGKGEPAGKGDAKKG